MRLLNLLPLALSVSAYSNIAARYDDIVKRQYSNDSLALVSDVASISSLIAPPVETSAITTTFETAIPTTDANGAVYTIYSTTTVTFYSTLQVSVAQDQPQTTSVPVVTEQSVQTIDQTDAQGSTTGTITSTLMVTVTMADASTSSSNLGATTTDSQGNIVNKQGQADLKAESAAPGSSVPTVTVTQTVYPSTCQENSINSNGLTTVVNKVPVVATFTLTNAQGDSFTVSTSTEVDQTITIDLTSTITPTSEVITAGPYTTYTTTIENTSYYGFNSSLPLSSSSSSEEPLVRRSFLGFFY